MRRFLVAVSGVALLTALLVSPSHAGPSQSYQVTPLWFTVDVGPRSEQRCVIVADQYLPAKASAKNPVPAILTTNGFGGSKDDQAGLGRFFAKRGYAVISYSGLGFGGSGCKISLDDPRVDGKAARQLISYLGGARGRAFTDSALTKTAPALKVVKRDKVNRLGEKSAYDPRVGMVGVSYGGAIQFATAAVDPRLDTIVPAATWNDLSYSLAPNDTSKSTSVRNPSAVSSVVPGAAKVVWALGFFSKGVLDGFTGATGDPGRVAGCPNYVAFVCPAIATAGATGSLDAAAVRQLRQRSVVSYIDKVRVPTLMIQGQSDTLFTLNESVATFEALRKRKVFTKLMWINGGHSGPNAPGEVTFGAPDAKSEYVTSRIDAWFTRFLKGDRDTDTGPLFSYFRDWVSYQGSARPAYATSSTFPVGKSRRFYLSGQSLAPRPDRLAIDSQTLMTGPAGAPTSIDKIDIGGSAAPIPQTDLPGTTATFTTAPMSKPLTVAGISTLQLKLTAPTAEATDSLDEGKVVVFIKVLDVASDGKQTHIRDLVAPVRVPNAKGSFTAMLPGFVHRFKPGHRLRLVVAGGSVNYRGGLVSTPVTIMTGSPSQVLTVPVVSAD